jgi:transposase
MVELVRAGRSPESLGREFEPSAESIRNWVSQADLDEGRRQDGLTTGEREEMRRLRRENRQLREEREILKKAAAWFAQETGSTPSRGSDSDATTLYVQYGQRPKPRQCSQMQRFQGVTRKGGWSLGS